MNSVLSESASDAGRRRNDEPLTDQVAKVIVRKAIGGHYGSLKAILDLTEGPVR